MEFYAGRWNYVVFYGTKVDILKEKLYDYSYRYKIGDYVSIDNKRILKYVCAFKEGDMYVCEDEIWVSTGEEYEWYRYKVMNDGTLMQRIKVVTNDDISIKHELEERIKYIIKPSHEQRKKNKKNGSTYLTKSEKNTIELIGIFILMSIIIEIIRILF